MAVGGVEGEFIKDAVTALAGLGVGAGTEAVNGASVVEGENVGGNFQFAVQDALAHFATGGVEG